MEDNKFLPNDFEFVGDKRDITIDEVIPTTSAWKDAVKRFCRNKGAVVAVILILIITLFAILAPMFSSWDYAEINTSLKNIAPNGEHLLGWLMVWYKNFFIRCRCGNYQRCCHRCYISSNFWLLRWKSRFHYAKNPGNH